MEIVEGAGFGLYCLTRIKRAQFEEVLTLRQQVKRNQIIPQMSKGNVKSTNMLSVKGYVSRLSEKS